MIWRELVAFVKRAWAVEIEDGDWCGVRVEMEGRERKVAIKLAANEPSIIVMAQVCALRHIDPRRALEYNNFVEHWTLALEREVYVLRRTLPLPSLTEAALDATVRTAASEAARLHRHQPRIPELQAWPFGSPFAHWA